jgi:hypothetical protein
MWTIAHGYALKVAASCFENALRYSFGLLSRCFNARRLEIDLPLGSAGRGKSMVNSDHQDDVLVNDRLGWGLGSGWRCAAGTGKAEGRSREVWR